MMTAQTDAHAEKKKQLQTEAAEANKMVEQLTKKIEIQRAATAEANAQLQEIQKEVEAEARLLKTVCRPLN